MKTLVSHSEKETMTFSKKLAGYLQKGDILILSGDLGSGKTKFTEGILSYFGLEEEISSPTFTIVNEYIKDRIILYHFDVYRLQDIDEFYAIGGEEYFDKGICIIEWGEFLEDILPDQYLKISFSRNPEDETIRVINFEPHGEHFNNLMKIWEEKSENISDRYIF